MMRIFGATLIIIAVTVGIFVSATNEENPTAIATAETAPAFLTNDEENNISVFKSASPSVVFVTNTQLRRQRFSLNVMEIPRGSGTGLGLAIVKAIADRHFITIECQSSPQSGTSFCLSWPA